MGVSILNGAPISFLTYLSLPFLPLSCSLFLSDKYGNSWLPVRYCSLASWQLWLCGSSNTGKGVPIFIWVPDQFSCHWLPEPHPSLPALVIQLQFKEHIYTEINHTGTITMCTLGFFSTLAYGEGVCVSVLLVSHPPDQITRSHMGVCDSQPPPCENATPPLIIAHLPSTRFVNKGSIN